MGCYPFVVLSDKNIGRDQEQMPYNPHPSNRLRMHFQEKPWQGCDPTSAKFLFVGLDANFAPNSESLLPEIFDYLCDGVLFWQTERDDGQFYHHPFRLPHYNGDGKPYHDKFAEISFEPKCAECVSFVELLHVPTIGKSSLENGDLSPDHLCSLKNIFDCGTAKYVFTYKAVSELMRQTKAFPWLRPKPRKNGDLKVLRDKNGQHVYQMYHLSCHYRRQLEVLNRQIAQICTIVEDCKRSCNKPDIPHRR